MFSGWLSGGRLMINPGCYNGVPIRQVVDWKQSLLRFRWRLHHGRTPPSPRPCLVPRRGRLHSELTGELSERSRLALLRYGRWGGDAWVLHFRIPVLGTAPKGIASAPGWKRKLVRAVEKLWAWTTRVFPYEGLKQVDFWDYKMENSQPVEKACGVESFRRLCPWPSFRTIKKACLMLVQWDKV